MIESIKTGIGPQLVEMLKDNGFFTDEEFTLIDKGIQKYRNDLDIVDDNTPSAIKDSMAKSFGVGYFTCLQHMKGLA